MRSRVAVVLALLALVLMPGAPARSQDADAAIPVGEFLARVATALGLPAPAGGFTPQNAGAALRGVGIVIEKGPATPLTEGDAVKVMTALGYRVVSRTPSRTVGAARADLLISTFILPAGAADEAPSETP